MKRHLLSLTLALALLVAAIPPAQAAGTGLITTQQTYEEQFTDVAADAWYYTSVKALYELGLTTGKDTPDRFAPESDMTVAEAVTMAARLRSLYSHGNSEIGPARYSGGSWYTPYVSYLQDLGVIGREFDGLYQQSATRAQMAHILAGALPLSAMEAINADAVAVGYANRRYIRDVGDYTPYQQDILNLYRWGILSGMDGTGSFLPDETIQRSQVAAMVARLAFSDLRIRLDWDLELDSSRIGTTLESLVPSDGTFHSAPAAWNTRAVEDNLRYMLSQGERRMVLSYPKNTLTPNAVSQVLDAFLKASRHYLEQTYNKVSASYSIASGTLVLTFSSSLYEDRMIDSYREATMEEAIKVHDQLWADGTITPSMSEYEKARAYFIWLCDYCDYDFHSNDTSMSHTGYSAFVDRLAVCDGYTAAYNLLLKLEGISCTTMSIQDHIWTVATLDGTKYHIDPTWGDQTGQISYLYFGMAETASLARFS